MMWGEIILDILPNGGGVGVLALLIFEVSGNADFEFANDELSKAKCVDRKDRAVRDPRRFVNDPEFGLLIHGSSFLLTMPIWASILKYVHKMKWNRNQCVMTFIIPTTDNKSRFQDFHDVLPILKSFGIRISVVIYWETWKLGIIPISIRSLIAVINQNRIFRFA